MDAAGVKQQLDALADPDRAAVMQRFFDTGPGGDGEGDVFLGPPVPAQRRVARQARDLPLAELATLLDSPVHEHRFVALAVLVERHRRAHAAEREELERFYLDHRAAVNHWDLVDVSAPDLLGTRLADHPGERAVLDELAASERVWDRRIAVLATFALIRRGELAPTFALAARLLDDPHHLIHKAVGWMLREAGKRDQPALEAWLEEHRLAMPRVMLRYAIEKLSPERRAELMAP